MVQGYTVIEFSGIDALTYLQAQLATDLRKTADLHWQWAALCSVKGRVIATGPLLRLNEQRWLWLIRADLASTLLAHLRRYVLRSKLTLSAWEQLQLAAEYSAGDENLDQQLQRIRALDEPGWELDNLPQGWRLQIRQGEPAAATDANALTKWENARMRHGLAMIGAKSSELHLSHPLELHRLRAVSVSKGCYPGQEIIARTHYLGRSKRALAVIDAGPAGVSVGDSVETNGHSVGTVVEAVELGLALAEVTTEAFDSEQWACAGKSVDWRPPSLPPVPAAQAMGSA